ncbi:MAG: type III pantothenate kinase [Eubacterium sp.]|nr:type III pantothenate kinase [Eubacterium sp.]
MILAIDIGNTHMVLGCLDQNNHVQARFIMSTSRIETSDEYAAELRQVLSLRGITPDQFEGAIISSVVPAVTAAIQKAFRLLSGKDPLVLGKDMRIPLELEMNGLPASAIAGDLLATAIAANAYYTVPAAIIDIGTATTITVLNEKAAYTGGCIMPGPGTAMKGLVECTALLPAIDFLAPSDAIAKDTISAMQSGIMFGSAGALDGILDRFADELGTPFRTVLVTGGMATIIAPLCRHEVTVDQDLLLRGLGLIWAANL